MSEIRYTEAVLKSLHGKVVVLTGGAQGIGAATVKLFQQAGANIVFGDWAAEKGKDLEQDLMAFTSAEIGNVHFLSLDVRNYASQLALFDLAYTTYGHVDIAVSCAAIGEPGGWFEPEDLNLETVRNVRLLGLAEVLSLIAQGTCTIEECYRYQLDKHHLFLSTGFSIHENEDTGFSKSMILVSSIAGITEAPGLFAYSSAKHGVIGLMRALRPWAPVKYNVRVNAICPWATDTQILAGVKRRWVEEDMPLNQPEDVAKMILQSAADGQLHGKAIYVAGGKGFDTEEGYDRCLTQWMGETNAKMWLKGQEILGLGDDWTET